MMKMIACRTLLAALLVAVLPATLLADEKVDSSRKWSTYGTALYKNGKIYEAKTAYENALKWHEGNPHAWQGLGNVRIKLGDRPGALEAYQKALNLRPGNTALRKYVQGLNVKQAPAPKKELASTEDLEELLEDGEQLIADQDFPNSLAFYQALESKHKDRAEIYKGLGESFYGLGRMDEARLAYRRSLSLNPDQPATQKFVEEHLDGADENVVAIGRGRDWIPSLARSAVLPGWGQYRNGQKSKAVILGLSTLAIGGGFAYSYVAANKAYDDYSALGAGTPDATFDESFGKVENLARVNHALGVVFYTTYLYNLIDSIWYAPALENVQAITRVTEQGTAMAGLSVKF